MGKPLKWEHDHVRMIIRDVGQIAGIASSAATEIEQGTRIPRANTGERLGFELKVPGRWLVFVEGIAPTGWFKEERSNNHLQAIVNGRIRVRVMPWDL